MRSQLKRLNRRIRFVPTRRCFAREDVVGTALADTSAGDLTTTGPNVRFGIICLPNINKNDIKVASYFGNLS